MEESQASKKRRRCVQNAADNVTTVRLYTICVSGKGTHYLLEDFTAGEMMAYIIHTQDLLPVDGLEPLSEKTIDRINVRISKYMKDPESPVKMKIHSKVRQFDSEKDAITAKEMALNAVWTGAYETPCVNSIKGNAWFGPADAMVSYHHIVDRYAVVVVKEERA